MLSNWFKLILLSMKSKLIGLRGSESITGVNVDGNILWFSITYYILMEHYVGLSNCDI